MQPHGLPPFNPPAPPSGLSQAESRVFELQAPPQHSPSQAAATSPSSPRRPPITAPSGPSGLQTPDQQLAHDHAVRQRRLGRACDACSKRKVKCGDVVPCRNCISLGVECTFARPAKRRGPANRVAEDLKRARFEVNDLNTAPVGTFPGPPPLAAAAGPPPPNTVAGMPSGLDGLAPPHTITRMVYDFFTYVYPIFPFPHEHLVMDRLRKREDTANRSFCALIASLLATLGTLFPRVAQVALAELEQNGNVIATDVFVGRCMLVCEQYRGALGSARDVDDAATAFFVGIVSYGRRQMRLVDLFMAEAVGICRFLGVEEEGVLADGAGADYVTRELCRRIYWGVYHFDRLHASTGRPPINPARRTSDLPPLSLSTDDYYIYIDRISPSPQGQLSTLDAFNLSTRIYLTLYPLARFTLLEAEQRSWDSTRAQISEIVMSASRELETILSTGHPELANPPNPRVFEAEGPGPSQHEARMHVRWEIGKIMARIALVVAQCSLAEILSEQMTDENREDMRRVLGACEREVRELLASVTEASMEAVVGIVEGPLGRVLEAMGRMGVAGVEELSRRAEEVLRAGR